MITQKTLLSLTVTKAPPSLPVPAHSSLPSPPSMHTQPPRSQLRCHNYLRWHGLGPMRRGALRGGHVLEEGKASSYSSTSKVKEVITTYKSTQGSNGYLKQLSQEPAPAWTASWLVKWFLKLPASTDRTGLLHLMLQLSTQTSTWMLTKAAANSLCFWCCQTDLAPWNIVKDT